MKRLWILFKTEFNVWRHDPITALGGIIPSTFILLAFALLFGGRLSFDIGVVNLDEGPYGQMLVETFPEVISPLDNKPYYAVQMMDEQNAQAAFEQYRIEGYWLIPADFSARLEAGTQPEIDMYFSNYNDDRAKNHRIYSAEILWQFYQQIGLPSAPMEMAEDYPLPVMVDWVAIISVGIVLLAATLGGIFNMFILTYKAQTQKITLEFSLSPRSLWWVLLPKAVLSLIFGLVTGTVFLVVIWLWLGYTPWAHLGTIWLLTGLVVLFWGQVALVFGLASRNYMSGAVGAVLGAMMVFFIGGGLSMVRANQDAVTRIAWMFPNTFAVDPIRDLVLFQTLPANFWPILGILTAFAVGAVALGSLFAMRKLRKLA